MRQIFFNIPRFRSASLSSLPSTGHFIWTSPRKPGRSEWLGNLWNQFKIKIHFTAEGFVYLMNVSKVKSQQLVAGGKQKDWNQESREGNNQQRLNPSIQIRVWQIFSNIQIYWSQIYIFGHSFVSIFLLRIYSDIRLCQICLYEYIRTFVGVCSRV